MKISQAQPLSVTTLQWREGVTNSGDGAKIIEDESSSLQSPVTPLGDDMVFSPVKDDTPIACLGRG